MKRSRYEYILGCSSPLDTTKAIVKVVNKISYVLRITKSRSLIKYFGIYSIRLRKFLKWPFCTSGLETRIQEILIFTYDMFTFSNLNRSC